MSDFQMFKADMVGALSELGQMAFEAGRLIDVGLYGGSALILASNFRDSSKDMDIVVVPLEDIDTYLKNEEFIKIAAQEICVRKNWPRTWFDDGVKTFISPKVDYHEGLEYLGAFPDENTPGLKAFVPNAKYLLGMKLKACRMMGFGETKSDLPDIVNLMQIVKPQSREKLVKIGADYFPELRTDGKLHMYLHHIWTNYEEALRHARIPAPRYPISSYPRIYAG